MIEATRKYVRGMGEGGSKTLAFVASLSAAVLIGPSMIRMVVGIIRAIRAWITANITLQAISGPAGWATLAAGLAIAAASVYAVDVAFESQNAAMAESTQAAKAEIDSTKKMANEKRGLAAAMAAVTKERASAHAPTAASTSYGSQRDDLIQQNLAFTQGEKYARERLLWQKGMNKSMIDGLNVLRQRNAMLGRDAKIKKERQALVIRNMELKRGVEYARQYADHLTGHSKSQRKELRLIRDRNRELDKIKERKTKLQSLADGIVESMKTPFDNLVQRIAEINAAQKSGLINARLAAGARQKAAAAFRKQPVVKVQLPPTITQGSREAYKLIAEMNNGRKAKAEAMHRQKIALWKAQLEAQKRTNELLEGKGEFEGVS